MWATLPRPTPRHRRAGGTRRLVAGDARHAAMSRLVESAWPCRILGCSARSRVNATWRRCCCHGALSLRDWGDGDCDRVPLDSGYECGHASILHSTIRINHCVGERCCIRPPMPLRNAASASGLWPSRKPTLLCIAAFGRRTLRIRDYDRAGNVPCPVACICSHRHRSLPVCRQSCWASVTEKPVRVAAS